MTGFAEASHPFDFRNQGHSSTATLKDPWETKDIAAHDMLAEGLTGAALDQMVAAIPMLQNPDLFETAAGMSIRTLQRARENPEKRLSPELSGRVWSFADLHAKAVWVFGTAADAQDWFTRPAMGLNQRRPIDLLSSPAGAAVLDTFLYRLDYGVYQ